MHFINIIFSCVIQKFLSDSLKTQNIISTHTHNSPSHCNSCGCRATLDDLPFPNFLSALDPASQRVYHGVHETICTCESVSEHKKKLKKKKTCPCRRGLASVLAAIHWNSSKNRKSARAAAAEVRVPVVQHERGYLVSARVQKDQRRSGGVDAG